MSPLASVYFFSYPFLPALIQLPFLLNPLYYPSQTALDRFWVFSLLYCILELEMGMAFWRIFGILLVVWGFFSEGWDGMSWGEWSFVGLERDGL